MLKYLNTCVYFLLVFALIVASSCKGKKPGQSVVAVSNQLDKGDTSNVIKGNFDIAELQVEPSPLTPQSISFSLSDQVIAFDVAPTGPLVATLLKGKNGNCIQFWRIGESGFSESCQLPAGFMATEIKWHPTGIALFVTGTGGKQYQILRVEKTKNGWEARKIFSSPNQLRNLLVCPRPFITSYQNGRQYFNYRLFFGESYDQSAYRIVSTTENGGRFYQVVGPEKTFSHFDNEGETPSEMKSNWALPLYFHTAGHELIWKDKEDHLFSAGYNSKVWGVSTPLNQNLPVRGDRSPTPNGLGFTTWQQNKPGIELFLYPTGHSEHQLSGYNFISGPRPVSDGKGMVGLCISKGVTSLNYALIKVPLPDVVNAWMFTAEPEYLNLLEKNDGLLRPTSMNQLYKLYDTENYLCGGYDRTVPTRPYIVTTDIFWELYAAAYEGLFVINERYEAIPNFWHFVTAANDYYKTSGTQSAWASVFTTLEDIHINNTQSAEVKNIQAATGTTFSAILKRDYNYAELKPRGHYTSEPGMEQYFKAFKYFITAVPNDNEKLKQELNALPADIRKYAEQWIKSYTGFIAPSRTPMVWSGLKNSRIDYNLYPGEGTTVFPLSWGFDNEVLLTDVYHENAGPGKQITGSNGPRWLPSGLDLATVLGSTLADQLMQKDYELYPPLRKAIEGLKQNFKTNFDATKSDNLYDKWLYALSRQWTDTLSAPNGKTNENLWKAKRLQTGLASWATLRHATTLVNERGAAECGEGGFEDILLRAPRGYVEPDPLTFAAIADLLETSVKYVAKRTSESTDLDEPKQSLYDGITKRLKEAAKDARLFQSIAEKEKKGEPLSNEDYEKILYIGRVAEHDFLIFKSLANRDFGLADPEPMAKIADVFGGGISPYLMSAVGNVMEWDNLVPFYGRHALVKGAVYSYYEFSSPQLLDDNQWREKMGAQQLLPWVKPFVSQKDLSTPVSN